MRALFVPVLTGKLYFENLINIFDDIQVACCYDGGKALKEINFGGFDYMIFDLKLPVKYNFPTSILKENLYQCLAQTY